MDPNFWIEKWKKIEFEENISEKENYLISTLGRVKSLKKDSENGLLIKVFSIHGYARIPLMQKSGKRTARYIHKLVAQTFIPKTDEKQKHVIHLDYDKDNNTVSNLVWATKEDKEKHQFSNPLFANPESRIRNSKLTVGRVRMIKKKLLDPNRKTRLKMIAKQFGISQMQLHRIKTGENWGYVKIDEPKNN